MKQQLGLTPNHSPRLDTCDNWYRLVALAMHLRLAAKAPRQAVSTPWYPRANTKVISQRRAQKQARAFFLKVDIPSVPSQPAGKARGRPKGYHPPPSKPHPVIRKLPKRTKACPTCPFKAAA